MASRHAKETVAAAIRQEIDSADGEKVSALNCNFHHIHCRIPIACVNTTVFVQSGGRPWDTKWKTWGVSDEE